MVGAPTDGYIHRSHLVDTGGPYDLVSVDDLQECDTIRKATEVVFATANAEVLVNQVVDMQIGPLGEASSPYVMKSTPLVLTVGTRCKQQGYGFYWPPWSRTPYFELPGSGAKVFLTEENGCAYLDDKDLICPVTRSVRLPREKSSQEVVWTHLR